MKQQGGSSSSISSGGGRSAMEREKTKMRERQRRSITTKIFNGLRKHGGYNLPARSDINDVLRELAKEAGWIVEPDGTTYRRRTTQYHPFSTTTPTATTNLLGTSLSYSLAQHHPQYYTHQPQQQHFQDINGTNTTTGGMTKNGGGTGQTSNSTSTTGDDDQLSYMVMSPGILSSSNIQQLLYFHHHQQQQQQAEVEARASNQNTPFGSPQRPPF